MSDQAKMILPWGEHFGKRTTSSLMYFYDIQPSRKFDSPPSRMAVPNFGAKIQTREGRLYYKTEKCYGTTTLGPDFPLHIH